MTKTTDPASDALIAMGVGPAAKELYVDLLRPAAREMGANLAVVARLVTVAFAPLRGMVWGLEKVQDWLSAALLKRLAHSLPENIQTPPSYIAGQILLQLPFCAEQEQLREMYANLLASAMRKDIAPHVHPAFVQVVQQLTPDEALILEALATDARGFSPQEQIDDDGRRPSPSINDQFRSFCVEAGVTSPELSDAYLENLLRLRIFSEIHWNEGRIVEALGEMTLSHPPRIQNTSGRLIELTAFGENFLNTCTSFRSSSRAV